ncbi:hypothetical protein VNI00_016111 [Paramarasmius palmivorus]|uniref:Uncharacterized protein n=1 Tax=Paramarasmius palmivorus TaxID=297713 RepID=A0AAW0BJF0_9AGAR
MLTLLALGRKSKNGEPVISQPVPGALNSSISNDLYYSKARPRFIASMPFPGYREKKDKAIAKLLSSTFMDDNASYWTSTLSVTVLVSSGIENLQVTVMFDEDSQALAGGILNLAMRPFVDHEYPKLSPAHFIDSVQDTTDT